MEVTKNENIRSREYTKKICSSVNFGRGSMDDEYVALAYVYNNEELREKYGESFEVIDFGGSAEFGTQFFGIYKATAIYVMMIDDDDWIVELSKGYFGKWKVTDCFLKPDDYIPQSSIKEALPPEFMQEMPPE